MFRFRNRPTTLWTGVLWIGGTGVFVGSVVFGTFGEASANGNATITANQGASAFKPGRLMARV